MYPIFAIRYSVSERSELWTSAVTFHISPSSSQLRVSVLASSISSVEAATKV
jgi:hypothetical protein